MKVLSALFAAPLMLIACGDDNTNTGNDATNDTNTTSDTSLGDVAPGTSALTGVNTNVTSTPPTPNAGCDLSEVDNTNHGARYPWNGFTEGATTYTCNKCPGGHPALQGQWRAFEYEADNDTPNYEAPAASDQAEILFVDGNTWYTGYYDSRESVSRVDARGYYFCTQKPEHPNEHLGWVILEADPEGALGYDTGGSYGSDVPLTATGELRMYYYATIAEQNGAHLDATRPYCKFGATSAGKTCTNPL